MTRLWGVERSHCVSLGPPALAFVWRDSFGIFYFYSGLYRDLVLTQLPTVGLFWYYVAIGILFNVFYTVVNLPITAHPRTNSGL